MTNVFSTGCSGTIGSYLPKSVYPVNFNLLDSGSRLSNGQNFEGSSLIHLAGVVGNSNVLSNANSEEINIDGAVRLAEECSRLGVRRFIYVSSGHVYGKKAVMAREGEDTNPFNEYGMQKLRAETNLRQALSDSGTQLVIVRLFSILGRGMSKETLGGNIEKTNSRDQGTPIQFSEDVRSFLSIKVAAEHLTRIATIRNTPELINLCSTQPISVGDAVTLFAKSIRVDDPILSPGVSDVPNLSGDNSLLVQCYRDELADDPAELNRILDSLSVLKFDE